ncbi:unnamed protein product [Blepharisma stoltei]|uniref:Uncharacterized protein n=1 Tax=Blepharisma stoltei TaxID=1481888 RepID=A0AAU9K5P8_9CILI|nr:unnamed protein product [Blepharisma stoltei]
MQISPLYDIQENANQEQVRLHYLMSKQPLRVRSWCKLNKEYYIDHIAVTSFPDTKLQPLSSTTRAFSTKNIQVLDNKSYSKGLFPKISLLSKRNKKISHIKITLPKIKEAKNYRSASLTTPDLNIHQIYSKLMKPKSLYLKGKDEEAYRATG